MTSLVEVNDRPIRQHEFMSLVMKDPEIPDGIAVAVALAIACRIRWSYPVSVIPRQAIADRVGTTLAVVNDVLVLLMHLKYLRDTGRVRGERRLYTAMMPPEKDAARENRLWSQRRISVRNPMGRDVKGGIETAGELPGRLHDAGTAGGGRIAENDAEDQRGGIHPG